MKDDKTILQQELALLEDARIKVTKAFEQNKAELEATPLPHNVHQSALKMLKDEYARTDTMLRNRIAHLNRILHPVRKLIFWTK